jgi:hypothetical protein
MSWILFMHEKEVLLENYAREKKARNKYFTHVPILLTSSPS